MNKLSQEKVSQVLAQVGPTLRALSTENEALKEKVAFFERKDRAEKLASQMETKHLDPDSTYEEKVEKLMGSNDMDVVEKAISLSAHQIKIASLSDNPGNSSDALSAFENAIVGD